MTGIEPDPESLAKVTEALLQHPDGSLVVVDGQWTVRCDGCLETLGSGPRMVMDSHLVFARHVAEVVLRVPLVEPPFDVRAHGGQISTDRPLMNLYSRQSGKTSKMIDQILELARERGLDIRVLDVSDSP